MLHGRSFILVLLLAACGGSSSPPPATSDTRTIADLGPMCHRYYARQATCTDDYLSAVLDLRIELDMPKGIGERVKTEGRDVVLKESRVQWESDMEPAKIDAMCNAMATRTPADQLDRLLKQGDACEAAADCKAFATCAVGTERSYIASGATHH
ncbi:hypothetical protein [Polyangium jinanense]|uniref:Lipoprotein n=1 Tax=Polyangium jinanense TaxID=2829994 RepID=A0A9X4AX97_9BACT|nr:hypothetical protein [Polyangium jinanense]MDC3959272.1 hypothetical protein [Polyangium jinanense]MDC3987636.1 hypothetical protein [Polyangium jinanense]